MPVPPTTLSQIASDSQLRMVFYAFMKEELAEENFEFYFSTESNPIKYNKFIRDGSPRQVNIAYHTRTRLDQLAQQGQWAQMNDPMEAAKAEIARLITNDNLGRFNRSDQYTRWWVVKNKRLTDKGTKAFALLKKDLGLGKKEAELKALMLVVEGGRTPADRKAAFAKVNKMMKLRVKAETHFRAAGLKVP